MAVNYCDGLFIFTLSSKQSPHFFKLPFGGKWDVFSTKHCLLLNQGMWLPIFNQKCICAYICVYAFLLYQLSSLSIFVYIHILMHIFTLYLVLRVVKIDRRCSLLDDNYKIIISRFTN